MQGFLFSYLAKLCFLNIWEIYLDNKSVRWICWNSAAIHLMGKDAFCCPWNKVKCMWTLKIQYLKDSCRENVYWNNHRHICRLGVLGKLWKQRHMQKWINESNFVYGGPTDHQYATTEEFSNICHIRTTQNDAFGGISSKLGNRPVDVLGLNKTI